jgi:hypothetical protein
MKTYVLTIILFAATITASTAQTSPDNSNIPHAWWGAIGIGASSLGAISGEYSINVQIPNNWLISAYIEGGTNKLGKFSDSNTYQDVVNFSLLAGKIARQKYTLLSVSAGLGLVDVRTGTGSYSLGTPYTNKDQYTVGVPIILQTYLVGLQACGIGLNANFNINTIKPTANINLCFALGRMQTHKPRF